MDLRQLECFVAVAEELHFRRAGERLGISQSALSERISALEHEIGAALLFRTTRQVSLTQVGAGLLRDATKILADVEKAVSQARHKAASGVKRIRVSGVDEAISMLAPLALVTFRQAWPDVHVQFLEFSSSDQHAQELINHRTDIAFIRSPIEDDFITSERLRRQPAVVVLAENHPLAAMERLEPKDIVDQDIVGYPKHARPILHKMLWSGFRKIGAQPRVICEVIDKSTLLQFVKHGLGIALAPEWVQSLSPSGVVFVPFVSEVSAIELYVSRRKRENSPTVDAFIAAAKQATLAFESQILDESSN